MIRLLKESCTGWKIGAGKTDLRGNPCLLDVSFLDSKRHFGSSSLDLFHILVEWEEGNPGNPLGKLEKDCCAKRAGTLGFKKFLPLCTGSGCKKWMEAHINGQSLDPGDSSEIFIS